MHLNSSNVYRINMKLAALSRGSTLNPPDMEPRACMIFTPPHPDEKGRRQWELQEKITFSFKQDKNP